MKTNALFAVASAALAAAAPSRGKGPSRGNCASKSELATFDNLPTLPAAAELSPVGNYDGLTYNSLDVLNAGVAGIIVTGLVPQSGSNVAVNGLTNELTSGNPSLTPVAPYKSLTLESLYFGCVVNTASSVTGVPEACTLAITAYEPGSNVAYQTINEQFDPQTALKSNLAKATLPSSWQRMGKIEFAIVDSASGAALTALFLDNVAYQVYECT